jgi:2-polyprenyl-3-methyl-5-hydroxy-6-metoxy-1,4-benzoquinol methylase
MPAWTRRPRRSCHVGQVGPGAAARGTRVNLSCKLCGGNVLDALHRKEGYDLVRCRACGLVFVANPPDAAALEKLYSFETGYHAALDTDPISTAFHAREAALNLRVLQRHARGGRLLDVGCSTGLFLEAARDAGWQVRGLEYSKDSSRIARDVRKLDVKTGVLEADTFEPASFDVVTLWDVIEHVPDPVQVLARAANVVAPGGLLVLKTPNIDGLYPQLSLRLAQRLGFWSHPEPPGHLYQFSAATLARMARQSGFEVVTTHHQRIPISYSFGTPRQWLRSAKWAAYCAAFIPVAWAGPWLGLGDDMVMVLRRPPA